MTDEMLAAIPHYQNSPLFTLREKAAFHFAELEILELGWRIAIFVVYGRLVYALGLEEVGKLCPLSAVHGEMQMNGE